MLTITDEQLKEWIATEDSQLWLTTIQPFLLVVANSVSNKLTQFPDRYLINDMVTQAALALHSYDSTKAKLSTYVYRIMLNHAFTQFKYQSCRKRDYSNTFSLDLLMETNWDYQEEVKIYNPITDDKFISFYCNWMRAHIGSFFYSQRPNILKIIDLIESPLPCKSAKEIADKLNIKEKKVYYYFSTMQKKFPQVLRDYQA
jgi:hypothetical protein